MQDDHHQQQAALSANRPNNRSSASASGSKTSNQTARVRWKPTAQQITILEHIFNSGTVNPPKDVTTNIRTQLEQFGPVEDVNIFYWFQNRRSRWSRRQRQMRSDSAAAADPSNANNHINFSPPVLNFDPSPQSSFCPDYNANIHIHNSSLSTNNNYEQHYGISSSVTMFPDTTNHPYVPNHPTGNP